jgi:L-alanine-DL-glutamate epimerase-like enolase superfamily enzyme
MWTDRGFEVLYVKVGRGTERDRACVAAIREAAGPGARLRVDANQAWTPGEAVQRLTELAEFDIDFAEQPVHWSDLEGLARVRAAVPMPVAADQGVFTAAEVLEVIRKQAADVIVMGLHEAGGILNLKKAAAVAAAGGLPICRHGVMGETGVATLASCQAIAAIPNAIDGHQVMHQLNTEEIVANMPDFEAGHLPVSTEPGIGVELDEDAVAVAAERYDRDGPFWPF